MLNKKTLWVLGMCGLVGLSSQATAAYDLSSILNNRPVSMQIKHDKWYDGHPGHGGNHKAKPKHHQRFPGNSMAACISRHDNGRWSRPYPTQLFMAQTGVVSDFFSIMLGTSGMHVVVQDDNFAGRVIIPLGSHSLSERAEIYYDLDGRPWRISKSWKKCKK